MVYLERNVIKVTYKNFNSLDDMINKLKKRSEINFQQDKIHTDQIITLSTCHENNADRIVVDGYKKHS